MKKSEKTLDELFDGKVNQKDISHLWLLDQIDLLNGAPMTASTPGYKAFTSLHKIANHWTNYQKLRDKLLDERRRGLCDMTVDEIQKQYTAQCQFRKVS